MHDLGIVPAPGDGSGVVDGVLAGITIAAPASENKAKYEYKYVPFENKESIRMLTLFPGQPNEPLRGSLQTVKINDAARYEAMSYVWADPGPLNCQYEILLSNLDENHNYTEQPLELIGGSLFAALRRVRLPDRPRRIWADQICINQNDTDERSHQVQFMNKIYKTASHVLVWLGSAETDEANTAFSLIRKLHLIFDQTDIIENKTTHTELTQDLEMQIVNSGTALKDLTSRSWFKRGWIVQEIGTAAPATMLWGDAEIDWDMLYSVCERLTQYHHLRKKLTIKTADIKFLFQRFIEPDAASYHANRFNFLYELHRARGLNFTDSKDRIFAFLGHYSLRSARFPNKKLESIKSNYKSSVEEVYIDVAKRALRGSQGDSALITLAAVQHPVGSLLSRNRPRATAPRKGGLLPSWVPDWRTYQGFILSEPISPHRAHGTSTPRLSIDNDAFHCLHIHGLEVDTIKLCSSPVQEAAFHGKKDTIEFLWSKICQWGGVFNLDDKYPNSEEAFFAFMQTLSNGCVQVAGREGTPYNEIPASRWRSQAAMYLVRTCGDESETISSEIKALAREAEFRNHKEEWSRSANGASKNRIFARTKKGYYVLGPAVLEAGDVVCVLFGGKLPFVLRPIDGNGRQQYLLVGECYAHGLMNGEALEMMARQELSSKKFEIV